MSQPDCFIGLDLGGTNLKVVAFSADGTRIGAETAPTLDDGTPGWLERAREELRRVLAGSTGVARVGVSAPGLIAPDGRSVISMPERLAGLEGLDWQEWLGLDQPVDLINDAKAALLGEVWQGAARGAKNVILLTLGTGVGGAAMVDGRILQGHIGRAGHFGHVSLDPDGQPDITNMPGSLEDAIGDCTVAQRSNGRFATTRKLVEAYRQGDSSAAEVWLRSVRVLAAAIAGFINVVDPELVLIGGGISAAGDALFQPLQAGLDEFEWRPGGSRTRLAKAALGDFAGATGAAYHARMNPGLG